MHTKLTVIVDNTAACGLAGEWGLSILVEREVKNILLDAGASELFAENMRSLGLDPTAVDVAVLSHAHYDHANGMARFFAENDHAPFYLREGTRPDCYKKIGFIKKYIGIPRNILTEYPDRIRFSQGDEEISEGVWIIPHKSGDLSPLGQREKMLRRTVGAWITDDFSHEQSLVLETDKGLVILNSCSHGGAVNIIREVQETFPEKPIHAYIGGLHLYNKTEEEVRKVARDLLDSGIEFICTGHCTGEKAYELLQKELGERLHPLSVGLVMEF